MPEPEPPDLLQPGPGQGSLLDIEGDTPADKTGREIEEGPAL